MQGIQTLDRVSTVVLTPARGLLNYCFNMRFSFLLFGLVPLFGHMHASALGTVANSSPKYIDSIVSFGDSQVDNGLPFGLWSIDNKTVPWSSLGYNNGRHTNKLMWTEYLSDYIKANVSVTSFGQAGATANYVVGSPYLMTQTDTYEYFKATAKTNEMPNPATSLAIIVIGSNDIMALALNPNLVSLSSDSEATAIFLANIAVNIWKVADSLIKDGFSSILISNIDPLEKTPACHSLSAPVNEKISLAISVANEAINKTVKELQSANKNTKVLLMDFHGWVSSVIAAPRQYGFKNANAPCLVISPDGQTQISICNNPDDYLYWDDAHFGSRGHQSWSEWAKPLLIQNGLIQPPTLSVKQVIYTFQMSYDRLQTSQALLSFKTDVIDAVALKVGIPTSYVTVESLKPGSVIATTQIVVPSGSGYDINVVASTLITSASSTFSPTFLGSYGVSSVTATNIESVPPSESKTGLSTGAIIGIAVGGEIALILIGLTILLIWKRRQQPNTVEPEPMSKSPEDPRV